MSSIQGQNTPEAQNNSILAAIDLGSNSFHMIIAKDEHGEIRPIERIGEKVQLAKGLEQGYLSTESIDRGIACLTRFKQVLDSIQPRFVRVVGTNTLRAAKNAKDFNQRAEALLGRPIEIVAGREEARLVFLGVAHTLADDDTARLVIDIGGGSTEFIIGQRFETQQCESLHMGCVSYTQRFFSDGRISGASFNKAYNAACRELTKIKTQYDGKWQECIGSSGTFKALAAIAELNGWSEEGITPRSLSKIKHHLLKANTADDLSLEGLIDARKNVITAGCAIATAIFNTLGVSHMRFSSGALREGVIYDTLGRLAHEDVRERTVAALEKRYGINTPNLDDILIRCRHFYDAVAAKWSLTDTDLNFLLWAARLHEIGLTIAHTRYHRHGQYLLDNADLPGFSRRDQHKLALLVRSHRRKLPKPELQQESEADQQLLIRLIVILRLSITFKYVGLVEQTPRVRYQPSNKGVTVLMPKTWLAEHPLTAEELFDQQYRLEQVGFTLDWAELDD